MGLHKAPRGSAIVVSQGFQEFRFFSVSSCSMRVLRFHNVGSYKGFMTKSIC